MYYHSFSISVSLRCLSNRYLPKLICIGAVKLQKQAIYKPKPNLSLYSPYYAEACNELAVPISAQYIFIKNIFDNYKKNFD